MKAKVVPMKSSNKIEQSEEGGRSENWVLSIIRKALATRRKTFKETRADGTLPLYKKISYGAPLFSVTSLTMLIGIHGTLFFNKIGADVAFIAFFTALARSFDVITDPLMGWLSDRTQTRLGRRRPYMAIGCIGYSLMFYLLFSPSDSLKGVSVSLWFGVFYVIFYLFDTISNVPHGALGPELTDNLTERNSVFFWANIFKGVGILFGATGPVALAIMAKNSLDVCSCDNICPASSNTTLPSFFFNSTSCNEGQVTFPTADTGITSWCKCQDSCSIDCDVAAERRAFSTISAAFGLFYVTTMLLCVYLIKERSEKSNAQGNPPLVPSLLSTFRNTPFMTLLPSWAMDMTSVTMIGTMLPFYVEYVVVPSSVPECSDGKRAILGFDNHFESESEMWCTSQPWMAMGLFMLIGANILSMPFWLLATKKFGKRSTWLTFNLVTAVTNGLFVFVGEGDPKATVFLAFLNGIPSGAQFLTDSVVADIIDYDEFLTGSRSEGRFTIFQTFIPKIVSIPAQAIPLAILASLGFKEPIDGRVQRQDPNVVLFIKIVFFVIPFILSLVSYYVKTKFPIDEKIAEEILIGTALHMEGKPAEDPITNKSVSIFEVNKEQESFVWDLDNFFLDQLKLLQSNMTGEVVKQLNKNVFMFSSGIVVFLSLCLYGVFTGGKDIDGNTTSMLYDAQLKVVPVLSVIAFGLCLTGTLFNLMRLNTAKRLHNAGEFNTADKDLLDKWVSHREGSNPTEAINHGVHSRGISMTIDPSILEINSKVEVQNLLSSNDKDEKD